VRYQAQLLETVTSGPYYWIVDHPDALEALEKIIAGQKATLRRGLASELEKMQPARKGNMAVWDTSFAAACSKAALEDHDMRGAQKLICLGKANRPMEGE